MLSKRAILSLVATAVGLAALVICLRRPVLRATAEHLSRQIQQAPEQQIERLLRQAAAWGEAGMPVLADALGSRREAVARAAGRVIRAELDRWKRLPLAERTARLAALTRALAERVDRFGSTARSEAAELAAGILLWPLDSEVADSQQVVADCQRILQACGTSPPVVAGVSVSAAERTSRSAAASMQHSGQHAEHSAGLRPFDLPPPDGTPQSSRRISAAEEPVTRMARLPGGGLPVEWFPQQIPEATGDLRTKGAEVEPGLLPGVSDAEQLAPAGRDTSPQPDVEQPDSGTSATTSPGQSDGTGSVHLNGQIRLRSSAAGDSGAAVAELVPSAALSQTADPAEEDELLAIVRRLGSSRPDEAAAARRELERRGFGARELALAKCLSDPRPEVRRKLAETLPSMAGVDAGMWLRWLGRDENPDVRLAAVSVMATTRDPALLRQVEQMAAGDPDPRVRRAAERVAQQRRVLLK